MYSTPPNTSYSEGLPKSQRFVLSKWVYPSLVPSVPFPTPKSKVPPLHLRRETTLTTPLCIEPRWPIRTVAKWKFVFSLQPGPCITILTEQVSDLACADMRKPEADGQSCLAQHPASHTLDTSLHNQQLQN
ncbi:hypothetical protein J6590_052850 [Homalodisca vitripennis]|nr:hypothetical protein J6590_052850 [Homalodisca vitripennis]